MFLETLWRDVSYGARMLWQKPAYSAIAVLTLALGIGANTAIFSVVNTVLLKPLPFDEPDRVMALGQQTTQNRAALSQFSFRNFADMREQSRSFDRLAAYYNTNLTLTGDREAQLLRGTVVTADLFPLLGVSPALGRTFLPEEDASRRRARGTAGDPELGGLAGALRRRRGRRRPRRRSQRLTLHHRRRHARRIPVPDPGAAVAGCGSRPRSTTSGRRARARSWRRAAIAAGARSGG